MFNLNLKYQYSESEGDLFDEMDIKYLKCISESYAGGPVGIETLSASLLEQKDIIEFKIKQIDLSGIHDNPVVTELRETAEFYPAEDYHQDYAKRTGKLCYQQWYVQYQFSPMPVISN